MFYIKIPFKHWNVESKWTEKRHDGRRKLFELPRALSDEIDEEN